MKMHLNLRQTMNFIVLQGFVNQKNDVSGRLLRGERETCYFYLIKYREMQCFYLNTVCFKKWTVRFCTLVIPVWDSYLARLCLSPLASPPSPSPPLFQVSSLLFPAELKAGCYRLIGTQTDEAIYNTAEYCGKQAYSEHVFSILLIDTGPPASNRLLGKKRVGCKLFGRAAHPR